VVPAPGPIRTVEGDLGDVGYEVNIMPWNTEDAGGSAMLRIWSRAGARAAGDRPERVIFAPEPGWHWPDLADPAALAAYVRQATAIVDSGGMPPDAS
jgi:hypothetical protein